MKTRKNKFKLYMLITAFLLTAVGFGSNHPENETRRTTGMNQQGTEHDGPETVTVTGELSGFDCAVVGYLCPTTHRGADYTVGVVTDDKSYYHLVNIPQSFFRQYFLKTVEVTGNVYPPYKDSVEPEEIYVIEDGKETKIYEEGYFIDEKGRRATFQNGEFKNDRWVVK